MEPQQLRAFLSMMHIHSKHESTSDMCFLEGIQSSAHRGVEICNVCVFFFEKPLFQKQMLKRLGKILDLDLYSKLIIHSVIYKAVVNFTFMEYFGLQMTNFIVLENTLKELNDSELMLANYTTIDFDRNVMISYILYYSY